MIRFSCLAASKTPPDLLDIKSEIKRMEVLKSISPKTNFFRKPPAGTQLEFTRSNYFFGIVSPHGNINP